MRGELVEREVVARPVGESDADGGLRSYHSPYQTPTLEVHNHYAAPEPALVRESRQRLAPWWLALMAVVAAVALLVWALNGPPVLQPIDHKHPNQHQRSTR